MLYPLSPAHSTLPRLRFMAPKPEDPKGGSGGSGSDPKPDDKPVKFKDDAGREWDFPANTKVEDMTAEEQREYWKEKAKKHEKNRKPDDFEQLEKDARAYREQQEKEKPEREQEVNSARVEGQREGIKATLPTLLTLAIKAKNPDIDDDDVEEIIDDLDLSKFVKSDGSIDNERVTKLAEKLAGTADGSAGEQHGDPLARALSHNQQPAGGSAPAGGSIAALQEEARKRMQPTKG